MKSNNTLISFIPVTVRWEEQLVYRFQNANYKVFLYDPLSSQHGIEINGKTALYQRCAVHGEAVPATGCSCGIKSTLNFRQIAEIYTMPYEKRFISEGYLTLAAFRLMGKILLDDDWQIRSWGAYPWEILLGSRFYNSYKDGKNEDSFVPYRHGFHYAVNVFGMYIRWDGLHYFWDDQIIDPYGRTKWCDLVSGLDYCNQMVDRYIR